MITEVGDRLNLDATVSAYSTRIVRWLNTIQQDISSRKDWAFLEEREIIQTVVEKTDGTVTATNASATITGSGTSFASTDVRSFIQIGGTGNNWYEITARASATSITISPAYGGDTVAGSSYIIKQIFYSLTSDVSRVIDITQTATPAKLANLGAYTLDLYQPNIETTGPPTAYALYRLDPTIASTAAKKRQLVFFPIPDDEYNLEVKYLKILSDLAAGDISQIPVPYHNVMLDGAEWMGSKYIKDGRESELKKAYEFGLMKMMEEESALDDWAPALQPSDSKTPSTRFLPFPQSFEPPA